MPINLCLCPQDHMPIGLARQSLAETAQTVCHRVGSSEGKREK